MNQLLHVSASPHIKDRVTTSSIMLDVIIALIPATLFGIIQFKIIDYCNNDNNMCFSRIFI